MRTKSWIFGAGTAGSAAVDAGLLVLRIVPMLLLIALHGLGKVPPAEGFVSRVGDMGFPAPGLFAWLAAMAEVLAAALVLVGLLARPAAAYVFVHFLIVVLVAHSGDAIGDRELPILFGTIALTLALTGPGRYSIDRSLLSRDRAATAAGPSPGP